MTLIAHRLNDILEMAERRLAARGIGEARTKAELLISDTLGMTRLGLYVDLQRPVSGDQHAQLEDALCRAERHEPIQYVLGQAEFMGHVFRTDARALIPRPETECLVEAVLACESLWKKTLPGILDVGTGTGCIVASLSLARPWADYFATDCSEDALALARENAVALGVDSKIRFILADLMTGFSPNALDAVVSNPPYIASSLCESLPPEIRLFEPRRALDGGTSGHEVMDRLVSQAFHVLRPGGRLFMEIGEDQGGVVGEMLIRGGWSDVRVSKDFVHHDRVIQCEKG